VAKQLIVLCGPAGSGKSTLSKEYVNKSFIRVSLDAQLIKHENVLTAAIAEGKNIIVDHMHWSKNQRAIYVNIGKKNGYETTIIVLQEPYDICYKRCMERKFDPVYGSPACAKPALDLFFSKYEPVEDDEADVVIRHGSF
jgi:predicted kinase